MQRRGEYKLLEVKTMNAICKRFRLSPEEPSLVKAADIALLATEKRDIVCLGGTATKESEAARERTGEWHSDHVAPLPSRIISWSPNAAKREFLRRFREWEAVRSGD